MVERIAVQISSSMKPSKVLNRMIGAQNTAKKGSGFQGICEWGAPTDIPEHNKTAVGSISYGGFYFSGLRKDRIINRSL